MQTPKEKNTSHGAPHVFLLGAGASKSAFPDGDRHGKEIPLLDDLPRVCELVDIDSELAGVKDFEAHYSDLEDTVIKEQLEQKIFDYFSSLRLPERPTLYDYLVLSLREKDVIATFNWDPFLYQACWRNHTIADMPYIAYLHGSVAVGYCLDDYTKGFVEAPCSQCEKRFSQPRLLYPVKDKNYNDSPEIKGEWDTLQNALDAAYIFTIFGYSAPESDVEAVKLMKEGWGSPEDRSLEEIEIIDILPREVLSERWSGFIHTHHYRTATDFYDSWLPRHPRRSCEAMWETLMRVNPYKPTPAPNTDDLEVLQSWFKNELVLHED